MSAAPRFGVILCYFPYIISSSKSRGDMLLPYERIRREGLADTTIFCTVVLYETSYYGFGPDFPGGETGFSASVSEENKLITDRRYGRWRLTAAGRPSESRTFANCFHGDAA